MPVIQAGSDLANVAAGHMEMVLTDSLRDKERVSMALSGGHRAKSILRFLAEAPVDWHRVDIYQVDERVAPLGDPARNLTAIDTELGARVPATIYPMPVDELDLGAACSEYASVLPVALDLVHLGLGKDGHTASLVPNDPVLDVVDRPVATSGLYKGHRRMTLTFVALGRARSIVWVVGGADKSPIVEHLLAADPTVPAGRVCQERATLITNSLLTSGGTP